jgi:hypothetical protein
MNNLHGARTTRAVSELAFRDASLQQAIELAKAPDRICATLDTPDLIQLRTKLQIVSQEGDLAAKQLVTRVREVHPPSTVAKQTVNWDEARAVKAVNNLRSGAGKLAGTAMQQPHQLADVFATYSDYFPGHLGEEARSLRGRLLSNWNPETVKAPAGKTNFLRSRSFNGLRGFSRVGGVLIGRDPIEATNAASDQANHTKLELPCRDIQWQWTQDGLRMVLIEEKGQSHVTRSHRLRIVQQALSYAADGRPLAVTIINTKPLPFRQVLLHPTLVDSPLGYRMNELDQFVYRYASDRPEFQSRTEIWEGHLLLYVVARAVRLGQIKDASIFTPEARELITASRAEAALQLEKALDANLPFREQLAKSLVDSTSLRDPRRSPLPGMSDYFDASLVQWIQKAVDATDDPATFTSLIEHEAEAQRTELASASRDLEGGLSKVEAGLTLSEPERLRYLGLEEKIQASAKGIFNWVIPAPTWSEVSGVREAPFSL